MAILLTTPVFFSMLKTASAASNTYYVDSSIADTHVASSIPDCTNYNLSTFSCDSGANEAFKTIADINAFSSLEPGDKVLFRKGQEWRESLEFPASGSIEQNIYLGAFGSGDAPIINGSDIVTGWSDETEITQNYQVAASLDDADSYGATLENTNGYLMFSHSAVIATGGLRFSSINIPQNTTLTSAILQVNVPADYASINTTVYGENTDNALNFSNSNPLPSARARTSSSVSWNSSGSGWISKNITSLAQEIINRAGWSSGNALNIISYPGATTSNGFINAFDNGSSTAAKLSITYSQTTPNIYSKNIDWTPYQVLIDGVAANPVASKVDVDSDHDWYYESSSSLLWLYSNHDLTSNTVEVTRRKPIYISNQNYIEINNISAQKSNGFGIDLSSASNINLINNEVALNASSGVMIEDGSQNINIDGGYVYSNGTAIGGDNEGIGIGGLGYGSSHITINKVNLYDNGSYNISIASTSIPGEFATDVVIKNCLIHEGMGGILVQGVGSQVSLDYNIIYETGRYGLATGGGTGDTTTEIAAYNNSFLNNNYSGILIDGGKGTYKNNILYDNGKNYYDYEFFTTSDTYFLDSDYNNYFHSVNGSNYYYHGEAYSFSGWKTASGMDQHSILADPKFVDLTNSNYELQLDSPLIDSGLDVNFSTDYADKKMYDLPTVSNTGSGGNYSRQYVDIGACEYTIPPVPTLSSTSHPSIDILYSNTTPTIIVSPSSITTTYKYIVSKSTNVPLSSVLTGIPVSTSIFTVGDGIIDRSGTWYVYLVALNLDGDSSNSYATYAFNINLSSTVSNITARPHKVSETGISNNGLGNENSQSTDADSAISTVENPSITNISNGVADNSGSDKNTDQSGKKIIYYKVAIIAFVCLILLFLVLSKKYKHH